MKLILDYDGDEKGFRLKSDMQADITKDAEALGYITNVLFQTAVVLCEYLKKTNPKYHKRIQKGIFHSMNEMERENNDKYPFTTFIITDEK